MLLENRLGCEDGRSVTKSDIEGCPERIVNKGKTEREIAFRPARVLMQDFTGVPAVVDLAAMRDAVTKLGGKASSVNPLVPVDLVIDHSIVADVARVPVPLVLNTHLALARNRQPYTFLRCQN